MTCAIPAAKVGEVLAALATTAAGRWPDRELRGGRRAAILVAANRYDRYFFADSKYGFEPDA